VIKRMFGENVTSRKISTQNRELMYRVIAYNAYRITRNNLLILYDFYTAYFFILSYIKHYACILRKTQISI